MKHETKSVDVKINDKEFSQNYQAEIFESADDVLNAMQSPEGLAKILRDLNYGTDLKLRAVVRGQLVSSSAGPEKAYEAMAKNLVKAKAAQGKTITLERALEIIRAMEASAE